MFKSIVKIGLTIIILIIITFFLWNNFGLFSKYNYLTARQDIHNGDIRIISYGFQLLDVNPISKKYGFRIDDIGCSASKQEINGIKYYNSTVKNYISEKNGKTWEDKYEKEVDTLFKYVFGETK